MEAIVCLTDSIIYLAPSTDDNIESIERIRYWFKNIKVILGNYKSIDRLTN